MSRPFFLRSASVASIVACLLAAIVTRAAAPVAGKSIPIAKIKHSGPVDFEKEILPILKNNCLACHNETKAKGTLNLETPQTILRGGDAGPAVVPKKPAESLLLKVAAHQDPELIMPPAENKVAASALKPEELGLLQLWIEQGAKGEIRAAAPIVWQPLPAGLNAIYAAALTRDGEFAACGRGNQIFVYHLPTARLSARLNDPQLQKASNAGAAHRDIINSLAFSPDGELLASGGYRDVKLWRRTKPEAKFKLPAGTELLAGSPDGRWLAVASTNGEIRLMDPAGKVVKSVPAAGRISTLRFLPDSQSVALGRGKVFQVLAIPSLTNRATVSLAADLTALAVLGRENCAVAGADGVIRILGSTTNGGPLSVIKEWSTPGTITGMDAAVAGTNVLLTGSADGTVRVWNVAAGKVTSEVRPDGGLKALAVRPDGKAFATVGSNGAALWRIGEQKPWAMLKGDKAMAMALGDGGRELAFWKTETDFRKSALQTAETNHLNLTAKQQKAFETNAALAKIATEKQQALTNATQAQMAADKALADLGPEIGRLTDAIEMATKASTNATALAKAAKDGADKEKATRLSAEAEEKAKLLAEAKAALEKVPAEERKKHKEAQEKVAAAAKAVKEADKAAAKATQAHDLARQDLQIVEKALQAAEGAVAEAKSTRDAADAALKSASAALESAQQSLAKSNHGMRAVSFSADGLLLATGGEDGVTKLWQADTGAPVGGLAAAASRVRVVVFVGGLVAAVGSSGGAVSEWIPGWTLERTIGQAVGNSPLADRVNALRFTPDSRQLITGGGEPTRGGELKLWRVKDGTLVRDFPNVHSDSVLALDISADGKLLASGAADRMGKVVDVATGKVLKTLEGHTHHVMGIAWKRNGRTVVTTGADNVVKVWDATTGERKKNIEGFGKEITAAAFVGIGDELIVSCGDGQVAMLKDKGDKVRSFAGASDYVNTAAVTPDGAVILGGGADGVLRVWNGGSGKILSEFAPR